ncbi:MAG: hypothetical protein P1V51_15335 [Deltaproteobacteria bacterium]|nr:hypothetical protein [Deltaproteobacteria bacterium]
MSTPAAAAPRRADPLARLALAALFLSLLTGLPLVGLYRPEAARASVEALASGWPFGWLLRGMHWAAATALVAFTLGHLLLALWRRDDQRASRGRWWTALLSGLALILVGLSGFVLRGDAEALGALAIWRGLLEALPLLGPALATLVLGVPGAGLGPVAIHHAGTFSLLALGLTLHHGLMRWPDLRSWVLVLGGAFCLAALLPATLFEGSGAGVVHGPWYLLGLQALLLVSPLWVAGLGALLLGGALLLLPRLSDPGRRALLSGLALLALLHLGGSLWLVLR